MRAPDSYARELAKALRAPPSPAQRRALAKAITLMESTRADHRAQAEELLSAVMPHTGGALRLGLSGVPGVGKSTFIETFGLFLIAQGQRVAVLAVDPSSTLSGGSILGDKTRMEQLSVHEAAFIRPSPSAGQLGGVAEKTRESLLLCEAAGFDVVLVETVGVGQSEVAVAGMCDLFVLLQLPNAGDELQAIKRGVMELADVVLINKADLDAAAAARARGQVASALHGLAHLRGGVWEPKALNVSAAKGQGLDEFWAVVQQYRQALGEAGVQARRRAQDEAWMNERISAGLRDRFARHPGVQAQLQATVQAVRAGHMAPSSAARALLQLLDGAEAKSSASSEVKHPAESAGPSEMRLDHINLRTSRETLEALRHFYTEVVGLSVGPRPAFGSYGHWLYAGGAAVLHLSETKPGGVVQGVFAKPAQRDAVAQAHGDGAGSATEPGLPANLGGCIDHFALALPLAAFEATQQRLLSHGLSPRRVDLPEQGQRQLFFQDPAGNGVELNFSPPLAPTEGHPPGPGPA
jgi:LAO/AO transport system kinase